jgi:hypothetical protein
MTSRITNKAELLAEIAEKIVIKDTEVLRRYENNEGGVIFIDAPGGPGKTFLINILLARIRGDKNIAVASLQH